jgi:hypothetical protein
VNGEGPAARTGPAKNAAARKHPEPQSKGQDDTPALFDPVVDSHAYGRTTSMVPSEYVRGPGPRPVTPGPEDAEAPAWWRAEAERVVLALIDGGHAVSADDLHERHPHEPSASGAAIGALFAGLARAGRIREVGMVGSRRPEARGRRIIL